MSRRRLPGRPFAAGPLPPGPGEIRPGFARAMQALRRAHRLMEEGQFEPAFPVFLRLADGAVRLGTPVRAASLYFQAARARLEMDGAPEAVELAQRGIRLLAQAGQVERARAVVPRLTKALEEKGFYAEAVSLRAEIEALLAGSSRQAAPPAQLPARCPSCNGPVRADEVEWIDARSAVCVFCGSTIRTQDR
ncbi:MAG: hypothetical protein JW934_22330 [Anaerolineae bacterium]|nr:hypothetical protein [Anaerolineae bacterium]